MKFQRIFAMTAVAAFALSTLTGCPWEQEGAASSAPSSSSSRPSHDSDTDSGSDDSDPDTPSSTPEEPEDMGFTYDEETGYTITSSEGLMNWAKQENVTTADCTLDADVEVSNWTKADVTGTSTIGGMVAVNQRGTIKGCDEEIKDMNTYLTDCEYEFALNKEKQPVLVKKGSAEQAVNRLLGHFWG